MDKVRDISDPEYMNKNCFEGNLGEIKPTKGWTTGESKEYLNSLFDKRPDKIDIEKNDIVNDIAEKTGGSYRDVFRDSDGSKHEVHHIPADSVSNFERNDGPAIRMDKDDHRMTASCGNSNEAREYREIQKEYIANNDIRSAIQMDIDDIRSKFDDKYDESIEQMLEYVDKLEKEEKLYV